jgi:hypothetical protein
VLITFRFVGEEAVDFASCAVVRDDSKAFVVHVEDEILSLWGSSWVSRAIEWRCGELDAP